jgi:anti-anti-sigma regulatory factor
MPAPGKDPVDMKTRRKKPGARGNSASRSAKTEAPRKAAARKPAAKRTAPRAAVSHARASSSPANPVTTVGADCTIEHAPGLHKQLAKVLTSSACVTLDVTAVKRCDTAGLQVLAAFIRERREAGREVALAGVSDNFLATAKLLGLSSLFSIEEHA